MSRNMWIFAALFAVMTIAMMYQESNGGIERPWADCKENLLTQMFTGACTPSKAAIARQHRAPVLGDGSAPTQPAPAPKKDELYDVPTAPKTLF